LAVREAFEKKGKEAPVVSARLEFLESSAQKKDELLLEVPSEDASVFSDIYEELLTRDISPTDDEDMCDACEYINLCQTI
jgi:hypothetical protein